ncbi:MAG TPA: hypothetical protein VM939_13040 [Gemmatimonadaceae bacterium]|nr:hypothetical protein [Gemmatimonadaceae bacterium]
MIRKADAKPSSKYGTIVIVGGGCYGSYYVRQLGRASVAGAVTWDDVIVVDRNPECAVAVSDQLDPSRFASPVPRVHIADWVDFFASYLSRWDSASTASRRDAIVSSPLMPHLMYEWLRDRAQKRWPARRVETVPLPVPPGTPWQTSAPDGTHYVSFAEWTCPVNCVEPERCPHTRGPRAWTMPDATRDYVSAQRSSGLRIEGPILFHCTHRVYGVGMFDTADVVAGDELIRQCADTGPVQVLIGTVSHCHGALNLLSIG